MPRITKIFIGILGIIIFIAIVVIFLGVRLVKKSLPQTRGTIAVEGLNYPVKVYRDVYGVPHIFAKNDTDLFFAMGYVVSQDRFWQMELNRRAALGTLSAIFGARALEIDKFIRTIGLPEIANQLAQNLSSESKKLITAYTAGINAYLSENRDKLPIEFMLLQYHPQPWEIKHSLAYQRLMAWNLEMAWHVDPVFGEIVGKVSPAKANEIIPQYPGTAPIIVSQFSQFNNLRHSLNSIQQDLLELVGFGGTGLGSNSWVVSGELTGTGKPILANDPHLTHQNPSIWYEIHLKAPGIDCYGVSLPGTPGIVIGHNQAIAWGLTNVMADGCDFFIEQINPDNQEQYLYQGKWHTITEIAEEIAIKDQQANNLIIRITHQGPIISDIHPALKNSSKVISVKWNGYLISDELLAFSKIMKAKNWDQFVNGLEHFSVPAQNYIYADTTGNIGYYCAGSMPIRQKGNGLIPQSGWTNRFEWKNWIPFKRLPHLFNPSENLIVTANNKVVEDNYLYFISTYWEPPYRAQRIEELLATKEEFNLTDFKTIQLDQFSKHAEFLMPIILELLPEFNQKTKLRTYFCHSLQTWDLRLDTHSEAAAIFEIFLTKLYKNIFIDEMGDTLFHSFLELANIPIRITDNLLMKGTSEWFDNISTSNKKETMTDVLLASLEETFNYFEKKHGETINNWRWGNIHTVTFEHVLAKKSPLNSLFNIGPFPVGGSCTSVNHASYSLSKNNFHNKLGPSMRQIVDLSNRNNSLIVITTGQSGHPLSKHFKDQTPLWLEGNYHKAITDSIEICNSDFELLILKPKEEK